MSHTQFIGLHRGAYSSQDTYPSDHEQFDSSHEVRIIHIKNPYQYIEPLHYHDSLEFIYCLKGPLEIKLNNQTILLKEHYLLSIPYLMSHQIIYDSHVEFIKCNITGRYMVKNLPLYPNFMKENISFNKFYEPLLLEMKECISATNHSSQFGFTSSLNTFLHLLQKSMPKHYENNSNWQDNAPQSFMDILLFIHINFVDDLKINDITDNFSISQQSLSRQFRKYMNMTFNEYLTMLRLDHARYLLINTTLSIQQILLQSGYSTKQSFAVAFRKKYHCTPSEFRQLNQSN
ncbi:helix-turn-helix domain-containing protein [Erysipelothrix urinaevulpis]|uniref:AraC family transcriptional regulator n=1 Tax=Erysipelothrix urinaevulpis TaxID=2683717 RepID=UPI00135CD122|nr:helix-turn-helix domain-containing protein [Erysipelothrix urinaevulpis]